MKPNYEESQFVTFFQDDMTHRMLKPRVRIAPIGQVLEAQLGIDMGYWLPDRHPLWRIWDVAPVPGLSGAGWNRSVNATTLTSSKAVNVFFQFKRSEYLHGSRRQYLSEFGSPYWRFKVDRSENPGSRPQHELLEDLEARASGTAVVRYVAPVTHQYNDLEDLCEGRKLLEACVYVEPKNFSPAHTACMFTDPDNVLVNPDPERLETDDWSAIERRVSEMLIDGLNPFTLITQTSEVVSTIGGRPYESQRYPWRGGRNLPGDLESVFRAYVVAAEWMFRVGVSWFVALQPQDS